MQVKEFMQPTSEVVHLDQNLLDAGIRMRQYRLSALAVVDGDEIVGLLTPDDIEATASQKDNDLSRKAVRDHMSAEIAFCRPTENIETARTIMRERGFTRLLVLDDHRRLCGLVTAEDLKRVGEEPEASASEHVVTTPGRRGGSELHQPDSYSLRPRLKE
ncbi:CBS domain-containing protein [Pelagibius sp. 7325]|uniref:CBS domain-containing protein n=1 Tax=Pelagibius sp. 7325 TaxID=3131994 RepID=UPI0030EEC97A